jgi:hypothetical protein
VMETFFILVLIEKFCSWIDKDSCNAMMKWPTTQTCGLLWFGTWLSEMIFLCACHGAL